MNTLRNMHVSIMTYYYFLKMGGNIARIKKDIREYSLYIFSTLLVEYKFLHLNYKHIWDWWVCCKRDDYLRQYPNMTNNITLLFRIFISSNYSYKSIRNINKKDLL